jgi:hypothetical protein
MTVGVPSGNVEKGLIEKENVSTYQSGSFSAQPGAIASKELYVTGIVNGYPLDRSSSSVGVSGNLNKPVNDVTSGQIGFSGNFVRHDQETGQIGVAAPTSGNLVKYDHDTADVDILFITGTYSSGVFTEPPVNYPTTGVELADLDILFVTGTYQGS